MSAFKLVGALCGLLLMLRLLHPGQMSPMDVLLRYWWFLLILAAVFVGPWVWSEIFRRGAHRHR